jgi:hypothetical protein
MKQRADTRAAKFLRPKFNEMIEWKQDRHAGRFNIRDMFMREEGRGD